MVLHLQNCPPEVARLEKFRGPKTSESAGAPTPLQEALAAVIAGPVLRLAAGVSMSPGRSRVHFESARISIRDSRGRLLCHGRLSAFGRGDVRSKAGPRTGPVCISKEGCDSRRSRETISKAVTIVASGPPSGLLRYPAFGGLLITLGSPHAFDDDRSRFLCRQSAVQLLGNFVDSCFLQ